MNESLLYAVAGELQNVAAEPTAALRKASLQLYIDGSDEETAELLSLILSFQIDNLFATVTPKFNTVESIPFSEAVSLWFTNQTKVTFYSLPYAHQCVIYMMSSTKTIGLSIQTLAEISFEYIDSYNWLVENIDIHSTSSLCPLCNAPSDALCDICTSSLLKHTEFRSQDFTLHLTHNTIQPIPKYDSNFIARVGEFKVTRNRAYQVDFTVVANSGHQFELPIIEYQTNLS